MSASDTTSQRRHQANNRPWETPVVMAAKEDCSLLAVCLYLAVGTYLVGDMITVKMMVSGTLLGMSKFTPSTSRECL